MKAMWHIQREEFKRLKSGSSALNILYQEGCTYVMDNHLAAGWCWYNTLDRRKEYNFCHIDQHDDLANDKHDIVKDLFEETPISLERYISLHYEQPPKVVMPPVKAIRWDNYILHMKSVFPHWFMKEVYVCHDFVSGERSSVTNVQSYDSYFDPDKGVQDVPIHPININCYDLSQTLEEQISNNEERLWIVNLDIDYFFNDKLQLFTDEYIEAIKSDKKMLDDFVTYLTINVSEFYRNPEQWKLLENEILPYLFERFGNNLKIWSAACSTGDEPYTLVMLLSKFIPLNKIKVIATDLDRVVLEKAHIGLYDEKSLKGLPKEYITKYFTKVGTKSYQISDDIKKCVEFKQHNLLKDTYPSDCNMIICRNVMIYFTEEAKAEIYKKFNASLKSDGILFVGSTEQIISPGDSGFSTYKSFFYKKAAR